jgi:hypothetical protein
MVLSAHNFGRHVARSSGCFARVIWSKDSGNSEVSQSQVALIVKNKILWFDISVDDLGLMDCVKSVDQAGDEESSLLFRKLLFSSDVITQISAQQKVHHQIKCLFVLEGVMDVDDEVALNE